MKTTFLAFPLVITSTVAAHVAPIAIVTPPGRSGPEQGSSAYEAMYDALTTMSPDPTQVAAVSNVILQRDAGTLTFADGHLFLLTPIDGRRVGAVFVGNGSFEFTPPTAVEREQVSRFYDAETYETEIEWAVLLFADSTHRELEQALTFEAAGPSAERSHNRARSRLSDARDYLVRKKPKEFDPDLMSAWLNGKHDASFYAHVKPDGDDHVFFQISPYQREEVSLSRPRKNSREKRREVVSQFHRQADYATTGRPDPRENNELIRIDDYVIESTIQKNLDFSAIASLRITPRVTDHHWVPLDMHPELDVDSAWWEGGVPAQFFKGEESQYLWIDLGDDLATGDARRLHVAYEGDILDREGEWIAVTTSSFWFPRYGGRRSATYDLTFHTPSRYKFVSVGELIESSEDEDEDMITTRWATPMIRNVTFNLGNFEEYDIADPRIPPVKLQIAEDAHHDLVAAAADRNLNLLLQRDIDQQVGGDLANSLNFFQHVFGPAPVESFVATEIPYFHGQAFPGLVLLSFITFQWTTEKGYDDIFRAHEVAHQWWGIGVDFATYHDQWLSEGLSDFAGLWYMAMVRGNTEIYFDRLRETKKAILDRRDEAGPIWLGHRNATSTDPGDYSVIVYQKGAWVFHMLRNILVDLETMDDSRFTEMLKDFYTTYLNQKATTDDFRSIVEKHVGLPMDWFFDQWVYGTAIPTYRFAYQLEETDGPELRATVRVRQEDVPDDFRMYVPILLDFGEHGLARLRLQVDRPEVVVELPLLPMKPKRIVLNDLEAVLAEVKTEGW